MLFARVFRLQDHVVLLEAKDFHGRESSATAELLARLALIETRRLYVPAGHPTMYDYCVAELHLSEDAALRRLNAARIARDHPVLFDALADGRIQLTTILTLATHLNTANAKELVEGATHKTMAALRDWLACRFPRPLLPTKVEVVTVEVSRRAIEDEPDAHDLVAPARPVPADSHETNEAMVPPPPRARLTPLSAAHGRSPLR